ncbi:MAG: EAL domain-containing protein [Pseudomonadota bacterium]
MQAEPDTPTSPKTAASVALRFWLLLTVILILAIACSIVALRLVAVPYFIEHQNQTVMEQARNAAQSLDEWVGRERLLMDFVANDPNVLSIALGHSENSDYFPDLLDSLPTSENLSWVIFYDALGDEVTRFEVRGWEEEYFNTHALNRLITDTIEESRFERKPALLVEQDGANYFAVAVPIIQNGFPEGALLAGYSLSLEEFFSGSETIRDPVLLTDAAALTAPENMELAPLSRIEMTLAIAPDISAVQAAGNRLISRGVTAIAAVLLGAFTIFAVLGRTVVVKPHQRLQEQAERLKDQKRNLRELAAIAELAQDSVVLSDLDGCITWVNPSFEKQTGYRLEDVKGRKPGAFLQGRDTDPKTVQELSHALAARQAVKVEILNYRSTGEPYWLMLSISPLYSGTGDPYGFVAISSDVTEARDSREALIAAKKEIEYQALHDPLTGLPNRRALDEELRLREAAQASDITLVRIDLDHFKYVNDTMGHEAGDFVLKCVAEILSEETKADDLAVRVGGDEFLLLLGRGSTEADGLTVAKRILKRIRAPKSFEDKTIRVGASFGVAGLAGGLLHKDDLIIAADAALYEAKEAGRNRVHLYTPELHNQVLSRRDIARELRLAVGRDEFEPFFQAQYDARTRRIVGVETLARWRSQDFGLVTPNRFLPIAEQLSIVEEIDDQILRKAIAQIMALREQGIDIPKLSVNVTAARVQDRAVYELIRDLPSNAPEIAFEVLESVLVEEQTDAFLMGLDNLRELGVHIEVDDFGSGHASIIGLMKLRPDAMKIDQRLVMPILEDPVSLGVLEQIISMAKLMELTVVAEGVETPEHADVLTRIGCHVLQGYHFCMPMPVEELQNLILSSRRNDQTIRRAIGGV